MPLMNSHCLALVVILVPAMTNAATACVAADPVGAAQWIYSNQRDFAFQKTGQDLSKRAQFLSPSLYERLRAEWKCQDVEEGICRLGSDPWINAQDGEERPPIKFELTMSAASTATVRMQFQYLLNPPTAVPAQVKLSFVRDAKTGCWLLDDLVGGEGGSLKQQLQGQTP